jgi:antitoxin component YwqK of YwqJK toxin-antitoxin module
MSIKYTKINKYIFVLENDILIDIEDFTNNNHLKEIPNFKLGEKYYFNNLHNFHIFHKTYEQAFFYKFLENHEYLFFENGYSGLYKIYDKDILKSEFFQINGCKEGIEKIYENNGLKIISENNYVNNKITEIKKYKNIKLIECIKYTNEYRFFEKYYENGELNEIYKMNYTDKIDGEYIKYFSNKKINIKNNYINGLKDGLYTEYWENGKIKIECNYKIDKLNGYYKEYFPDGKLKIMTNYKQNKMDGMYEEYVQNKLNIKCFYIDGCLNGEYYKYYDGKDKLQFICNYKYDKTESITYMGKKYIRLNSCEKNKHGDYIEFYESGEIYKKGVYNDNKLCGEYIIYKENGEIIKTINYK